jgi:D-alanine-D-alanine ligase
MFSDHTVTRLRLAVLAGGDSPEREVSLASGAAVSAALEARGHDVVVYDPAEIELDRIPWFTFDACFLALHGGAGEDGRVQQRLARLGVDFTGSDARACRLAMSKSAAKERFHTGFVNTPDYCLIHASESLCTAGLKADSLGYPLVVKPDSQGSSLGVSIVHRPEELAEALAKAWALDPFAIAEQFVAGRELTVALLDRRTLPVLEIVTPRGFFDYEAKYSAADTLEQFPADLSPETLAEIEGAALRAAMALGTRGLARVDLILDSAGRPWVLEVNTTPGMTDHSLAPKAARLAGIDMPELCDRMARATLPVPGQVLDQPSLAPQARGRISEAA